MKSIRIIFFVVLVLWIPPAYPMFEWVREFWVEYQMYQRYEFEHAYINQNGIRVVLEVPEVTVNGVHIRIEEIPTGPREVPSTKDLEFNIPPRDIVKAQIYVNGVPVSTADEISASTSRQYWSYHGWLDVVSMRDRKTNVMTTYVVQIMTDYWTADEDRVWKIIEIDSQGHIQEHQFTYRDRSRNHLWVKLSNFACTSSSMGYYTDKNNHEESLIVPFLFPWLASIFSTLLLINTSIIWIILAICQRILRNRRI